MMLAEQQPILSSTSPNRSSSSRSSFFWNSFSLSQTGIAMRNDVNPRGAMAM